MTQLLAKAFKRPRVLIMYAFFGQKMLKMHHHALHILKFLGGLQFVLDSLVLSSVWSLPLGLLSILCQKLCWIEIFQSYKQYVKQIEIWICDKYQFNNF